MWNLECSQDATLPGCNSCDTISSSPNCTDPFCRRRICSSESLTQCCDSAWTGECVAISLKLCQPAVIPVYDNKCPLGFICDENLRYKANCTEIRQIPIDYKFGDLFAGSSCAEGDLKMTNCPIGKYCETPEVVEVCPAGKFCPHKSAEPWIDCPSCDEGALRIARDSTGPLIILLVFLVIAFAIIASFVRRKLHLDRLLTVKMLSRSVDHLNLRKRSRHKQQQLDRLHPTLVLIAQRMGSRRNASSSLKPKGAPIKSPIKSFKHRVIPRASIQLDDSTRSDVDFDHKAAFDDLDVNGDGVLSFEEINAILRLEQQELKKFVKRMNSEDSRSGHQNPHTVSRPAFVAHFLDVLDQTMTLKISPEEAAATYDEIVASVPKKILYEKMLYHSSLSYFLSETEIWTLIKKFRAVRSITTDEEKYGPAPQPLDDDDIVSRDNFVAHYPVFLRQITESSGGSSCGGQEGTKGVDICFQDLSLRVKVGKNDINVVDRISGRIRAKTMTAIMGGSGAGKTSALNALCGRAHYGEVLGETYVNGKKMDIDGIKKMVGFVPQDDTVYAELTVRENFMYAGKLRLSRNTRRHEIEDLADTTLANLGLSRVANSLVGDVKRRGVSGGEKKRVNIGVELMARPSCLFLDEPTSGLDSSSALLVMSSIKNLVVTQGVTVATVIHQPRKFIFDLFDSLILLGIGGRTIYHGPTSLAYDYFSDLDYSLPKGEALGDWLIDISCGQIHPTPEVAATKALEERKKTKKAKQRRKKKKKKNVSEELENDGQSSGVAILATKGGDEDNGDDENFESPMHSLDVTSGVIVGKGVTVGKVNVAIQDAMVRRKWLHDMWENYFDNLSEEEKAIYTAPKETDLPDLPRRKSFLSQLMHQLSRAFRVSNRNMYSKLIDTAVLIVAVVVITVLQKTPIESYDRQPNIPFESLVNPTEERLLGIGSELFRYSLAPQYSYPMQVGLVVAVLISLQTSKLLTSKQIEFFREASSGYNINAYFIAVNVVATFEVGIESLLVAFSAAMFREPAAEWFSYFAHFVMLGWVAASWALLFPMFVPHENVTVVIGFFMVFFSLLTSGAIPPVSYSLIYEGGIEEHIAAWLSPTRFFIEGLAVGEHRCLPPQSGWTVADDSVNFDRDQTLMRSEQVSYAMHDPNATIPSCEGYYWGLLPSFCVGLTIRYAAFMAMHIFNRAPQTKKPLLFELKRSMALRMYAFLSVACLFVFGWVTTWLYSRDIDRSYDFIGLETWLEMKANNKTPGIMEAFGLDDLLLTNKIFDPKEVIAVGID